jgi:hypothetical protein
VEPLIERGPQDQAALAWPTVVAIFSMDNEAWQYMRPPLEALIRQGTEDRLFELFDALQRLNDVDKRAWLMPRLAERMGLNGQEMTAVQLESAIRQRFGLGARGRQPAAQRWAILRESPDFRAALDRRREPGPQSIADAAWLATLAFVVWRAEEQSSDRLVSLFDEMMAEGPRNLFPDSSMPGDTPLYGRVQRRPMPADIQARRNSLEVLENPDGHSAAARAGAFERLAEIANRFRDVTPEQADAIARFMLMPREISEEVAIEIGTGQMSHWPTLALALAEQLPASDVQPEHASRVVVLLAGLEFEASSDERWRERLRLALMRRVAEGLRRTAAVQGDDMSGMWDELRACLMSLYRIRCQAAGVSPSRIDGAQSPGELQQLLIEAIAPGDLQLQAAEYLARDELDLAIVTGELLVDVVAAGPVAARESSREDAGGGDSWPARCAHQLLANEQDLLETLSNRAGAQ